MNHQVPENPDEKNRSSFLSVRFVTQAAIIAGAYAALTVALAPISYGPLQVRVSEALTVLPFFTPAAIPGLFVGCLLANIISPYGMPDLILGSIATLLAALCSRRLRARKWLVPLPPVVSNGFIVGGMLCFIYDVQPVPGSVALSFLVDAGWIAVGEGAACYVLGLLLMRFLGPHDRIFRL
ncbi:MAG: QueT transporter family protein [Clostridiales Family XIII bacterium]|jgi:uncharacterized membrane protein|nr:QueT transporter family protein [Clostridiales Family XIII bacterium]